MYYLCCFRRAPLHLPRTRSHTALLQIRSILLLLHLPARRKPIDCMWQLYYGLRFISTRLIVKARWSEFRCGGAEHCSWLYMARYDLWGESMRRLRMKTNERSEPRFPTEQERISSLLYPNICGPIYHLGPWHIYHKSSSLKGELATGFREDSASQAIIHAFMTGSKLCMWSIWTTVRVKKQTRLHTSAKIPKWF